MTKATENTAAASNTTQDGNKWVERFGQLTNVTSRTDKNGKTFVTAMIETPKFRQSLIAFGDTAEKIRQAPADSQIWSKGPIELKTRIVDGEEKTFGDFTAVYFKVREPKAADAAAGEAASGEVAGEAAGEAVVEENVDNVFA